MKILHVITSLQFGGAEKLISEIAPMLRDKGNMVDVCSFISVGPNLNKVLEDQGVRVINFSDGYNVYNPNFIIKLAKLMKQYDVVHTHNTACQMFAVIGKRLLFKGTQKGPKLVTTEHSTSTRRRNHKVLKLVDRWMYSHYDKIICISEPSEESLRGYIGNDYPIVTIKNGVNIHKFTDAASADLGLAYKNSLGDFIEPKKITMVAGFRYEKDQPTVIKALKLLPEDYHLVLVGDGVERANIESLIAIEGLEDRVHLLGLRNDVPNILKASDVIVMSSHREGLSLSNVEGMCSGHPFVASDVEGLREVTKGYGVLFPHGDSKAFADIILKLCTDMEYADEVAAKCKERAMEFDISKMVEGYNRLYHELMNKSVCQ